MAGDAGGPRTQDVRANGPQFWKNWQDCIAGRISREGEEAELGQASWLVGSARTVPALWRSG